MTIELDLESAIQSAKKGDESGIVLLFRSFNPQLIRYLRHHIPYDYEDVASETWVAIAKGISDFSGNSRDFRAWMFGISRNKVADFFRTAGKTREALDREQRHVQNNHHSRFSDWTQDPAIANLSAEEAIETLVGVLSPHHAEVILLRVVADLSVDDVAKLMGKSPEAIRVIQHRALNTLAKRFQKNVVT
ncbi:MAG: sigma-70 family RNA polymerase sigma factor [Actinomycetota bacterium]|nr:MAG: sigma-70 family RNA polymerase sigma factor [Actinomycetota bacterium]